jgi:hypothetical protein
VSLAKLDDSHLRGIICFRKQFTILLFLKAKNGLITLFINISMLFYAINMDIVSLFADSSILFLAVLNLYLNLMYSTDLNEWISFIFNKKKTSKKGELVNDVLLFNFSFFNFSKTNKKHIKRCLFINGKVVIYYNLDFVNFLLRVGVYMGQLGLGLYKIKTRTI